MVNKYRKIVLLTFMIYLLPTCVEQTRSNSNDARFETYLNWERFELLGDRDLSRCISKGISRYGETIRQVSHNNGWDWRLITAIIYRESRFDPNARSWTGASGLMQIMPATAKSFGVKNVKDPMENIHGGISLLTRLNEQFSDEIPDDTERIKFVLASYNGGITRLREAQRLARKNGKNPRIWTDHVENFIAFKPEKKRHSRSPGNQGFERGAETFDFVRGVLKNYNDFIAYIPY